MDFSVVASLVCIDDISMNGDITFVNSSSNVGGKVMLVTIRRNDFRTKQVRVLILSERP